MRLMIWALGGALALVGLQAGATEGCAVRSGAATVPLVELYTSEGCSSCPPADRWFSKRIQDAGINGLAFHVDYWDDIGWPDRFASAAHTRRQRARVAVTGGDTVYTPQVMVGRDVRANWHSDSRFNAALRQAGQPAPVGLALRLQPNGSGWQVRLGAAPVARAADVGTAQVWLARYLDNQTTQVRAGENRGVTLHHDHVVQRLWGPWPLRVDTLTQVVELNAEAAPWGLVAFVQAADGRILQSLALPAAMCAATVPRS